MLQIELGACFCYKLAPIRPLLVKSASANSTSLCVLLIQQQGTQPKLTSAYLTMVYEKKKNKK